MVWGGDGWECRDEHDLKVLGTFSPAPHSKSAVNNRRVSESAALLPDVSTGTTIAFDAIRTDSRQRRELPMAPTLDSLPSDAASAILGRLTHVELALAEQTCRSLRAAGEAHWRTFVAVRWGPLRGCGDGNSNVDWRRLMKWLETEARSVLATGGVGRGLNLLAERTVLPSTTPSWCPTVHALLGWVPLQEKRRLASFVCADWQPPEALSNFLRSFSLVANDPEAALRSLLLQFPFLPIDAGDGADRVITELACGYVAQNGLMPSLFGGVEPANVGEAHELVHLLLYSIIMLNTDLHNPAISPKITPSEYVASCRRCPPLVRVPENTLEQIHANISARPLQIAPNVTPRPIRSEARPTLQGLSLAPRPAPRPEAARPTPRGGSGRPEPASRETGFVAACPPPLCTHSAGGDCRHDPAVRPGCRRAGVGRALLHLLRPRATPRVAPRAARHHRTDGRSSPPPAAVPACCRLECESVSEHGDVSCCADVCTHHPLTIRSQSAQLDNSPQIARRASEGSSPVGRWPTTTSSISAARRAPRAGPRCAARSTGRSSKQSRYAVPPRVGAVDGSSWACSALRWWWRQWPGRRARTRSACCRRREILVQVAVSTSRRGRDVVGGHERARPDTTDTNSTPQLSTFQEQVRSSRLGGAHTRSDSV